MVSIGPPVLVQLAGWKGDPGHCWPGCQVIAVLNGRAVGHLEFYLHPDNASVQVVLVQVEPAFRKRGLASLLMDKLYAAYPDAWINQGIRTDEGARW
ncbi:GNAT family N-acetyltransferase [Streptomyces mirabilis]